MSGGPGFGRALVTGAGGQLAFELMREAPGGVEVVACSERELDIRDEAAIARVVARVRPEVIVNAAAYTAVDAAESNAALADAVNHRAVALLAEAAGRVGARLVQVSTDYVFDGRGGAPYGPDAATAPLSVYGCTKRDGELAALSAHGALVVRTAWLYGAEGRNFVRTMLGLMSTRPEVRVVDDQIGTPTAADGLARSIWALVGLGATGVHHWTDAGVASWYDFAVAIREEAAALGLDRVARSQVVPIRSADFPTAARRPAMAVLSKEHTWAVLGAAPAHWRVALRRTLARMRPGADESWRSA